MHKIWSKIDHFKGNQETQSHNLEIYIWYIDSGI